MPGSTGERVDVAATTDSGSAGRAASPVAAAKLAPTARQAASTSALADRLGAVDPATRAQMVEADQPGDEDPRGVEVLVERGQIYPLFFDETLNSQAGTLVREWFHKYGCKLDIHYDHEKEYEDDPTFAQILNADSFGELVEDIW